MNKKLLALVLGSCMTVSMLAGCGSSSPAPVPATEQTEEAPAEVATEEATPEETAPAAEDSFCCRSIEILFCSSILLPAF